MNNQQVAAFDVDQYERIDVNPDATMLYQPSKGKFISQGELKNKEAEDSRFYISDEAVDRCIAVLKQTLNDWYDSSYLSNVWSIGYLTHQAVSDAQKEILDTLSLEQPHLDFSYLDFQVPQSTEKSIFKVGSFGPQPGDKIVFKTPSEADMSPDLNSRWFRFFK